MNNSHAGKFIFLIAVVGAVLFSRMAYPSTLTAGGVAGGGAAAHAGALSSGAAAAPLFDMSAASVSAGSGASDEAGAPAPDAARDVSAPKTAVPPPRITAAALLVADLRHGTIFAAANADRRWPTASITKLMTATMVADKLDPATRITITESMAAADPTETVLAVGGAYTVRDLVRMMLLPSSNVAAEALAAFSGRGAFLNEMNARARAWGMTNTYFSDPSGLSASNQSTANDFLKLAAKIYAAYPEIFSITRLPQAAITEENSGKGVVMKNINLFAGAPDFIGGKTGHTDEAAGNLLSVFNDHGRPIAIIVLGTENRFHDTDALHAWVKKNAGQW